MTARLDGRWARVALFLVWLAVVAVLVSQHVMWRDEVRGIIFARRGDTLLGMWRGLRGDAHPALWHLMLRLADDIAHTRLVLPAMALAIGVLAMALLTFASPFGPMLIALLLFGDLFLFEYTVMARNYGISVLLMFLIAIGYPRLRDRGWPIGCLLFLLANTNVHSVFLAGAFLLFWGGELVARDGVRWTPAARGLLIAALMTFAGAVLCFVTIYPTVNDAAVAQHPDGIHAKLLARALFKLGTTFGDLVVDRPFAVFGIDEHVRVFDGAAFRWAMSALLLLAVLQFARAPAAAVAALVAAVTFSLLFAIVYGGLYRHQGLWLGFLVMLRWILARRGHFRPRAGEDRRGIGLSAQRAGTAAFVLLLGLQTFAGGVRVAAMLVHPVPQSQAQAFARAMEARPALRDAVIVADPDWMTETLHYYLPNRTYLVREGRFGDIAIFTRRAIQYLSLDQMLAAARALAAATRRPVVVLLALPLDPAADRQVRDDNYEYEFRTDRAQTARFLAASCPLGRFRPAITDEAYDAYVVPPDGDRSSCRRLTATAASPRRL